MDDNDRIYHIVAEKDGEVVEDKYLSYEEDMDLYDLIWQYLPDIEEINLDLDRNTNPCYCGNSFGDWGGYVTIGDETIEANGGGCCSDMWFNTKNNRFGLSLEEIYVETIKRDKHLDYVVDYEDEIMDEIEEEYDIYPNGIDKSRDIIYVDKEDMENLPKKIRVLVLEFEDDQIREYRFRSAMTKAEKEKNWQKYDRGNYIEFPDGTYYIINSKTGEGIKASKKEVEKYENLKAWQRGREDYDPLVQIHTWAMESKERYEKYVINLYGMMLSD